MASRIINENLHMDDEIREANRIFHAKSVLDITTYINADVVREVRAEVNRLIESHGLRRDLSIKTTGNTPRRMTNVDYDMIAAHSPFLMDIYADSSLKQLLEQITGEDVHLCPYKFERMVITSLRKKGDSHGWHWDDYSFAMIWVLRAPDREKGGVVQCVPHTHWNRDDPAIISQFVAQPIDTYYFPEGSVYLMRSNTTMHRVYPLIGSNIQRTILNNAYASSGELSLEVDHSSMEELFSKPTANQSEYEMA